MGALLVELFEVYLNDLLNQVVHFKLVLNYLSDIHNLFALQKVQEVAEIFHDFVLVHLCSVYLAILCSRLLFLCGIIVLSDHSLLLAYWLKPLLMVLRLYIDVLAELIDEDCVC